MIGMTQIRSPNRAAHRLRRTLTVAGLALLAGCTQVFAPSGGAFTVLDEDRVFALIDQGEPRTTLLEAADGLGYALVDSAELDGLDLAMLTFRIPQNVTGAQAIEALEAAEPLSTVGINHGFTPQQTAAQSRPGYADALLDWPVNGCTARTPIGLIDTRVDQSSPALAGVDVVMLDFAGRGAASPEHGTEIAAVLADPQHLRNVTIYNAAVVRRTPSGTTAAGADGIILALDWLTQSGVRLVNLSLAGPFNKLLDRAIDRAHGEGMMIVAAVGNDGPNAGPRYPAAHPDVIAVTAIDADRRIYRRAVQGPHVDVAAPGVDVFVGASDGGHFVTGTSIATPFVTSRIATDAGLLAAGNVDRLRQALQQSSVDLGAPGQDNVYGAGLLVFGGACGQG